MQDLQQPPPDYEGYARVNTNAPTRLTVCTFLASISFAAFAVFIPNAIQLSGFDLDTVLVVSSEILLGAASVFFLIVATVMSIVLTCFGRLNFTVRKSLEEGKPISLDKDKKTTLNNLDKTVRLYDQSIFVMHWGVIAVLVSLLLLGFHVNTIIGVAIVGAFFMAGIRLRKHGWLVASLK